jgi:hypothetical protein
MPRELQPWGGDVQPPSWLRRLLRRPAPTDTPERIHEARQPQDPGLTVLENADRAVFGAWSEGHPGNKGPRHR